MMRVFGVVMLFLAPLGVLFGEQDEFWPRCPPCNPTLECPPPVVSLDCPTPVVDLSCPPLPRVDVDLDCPHADEEPLLRYETNEGPVYFAARPVLDETFEIREGSPDFEPGEMPIEAYPCWRIVEIFHYAYPPLSLPRTDLPFIPAGELIVEACDAEI